MQNFEQALKYVLIDEGGNDDDPQDHGGRTSRGITQREYEAWCRNNGKATGDVWKASQDDITSIYRTQYWNPYCDSLPSGVDYLFFDISVNAGRTRAVRQFQQALDVNVDGMIGQVTLDAIKNADPVQLIHDVSNVRRNWYRHLSQFKRYGKGWLSRVGHCENGAIAIHNNDKSFVKPAADPHPKATEPASTTVSPEASGTTAVTSGGLLQILESFKDNLSSYTDLVYVKYALIGVAVVSLAYAGYGFWQRSKVQAVQ